MRSLGSSRGPPRFGRRDRRAADQSFAITASITCATIMQGVDTTIANVALPHIQGSLSCSQDQIAWVVTSYIVAAAIMTPLTGWLASRFGIKWVFFISVVGFTSPRLCALGQQPGPARPLPGAAGDLRRCAGAAVAVGAVPVEPARAARPRDGDLGHRHDDGADYRPGARRLADRQFHLALGVLHQPAGRHLCALGILIFIHETRFVHRERFDFFGFGTLSVAVGAVQMMLDRAS